MVQCSIKSGDCNYKLYPCTYNCTFQVIDSILFSTVVHQVHIIYIMYTRMPMIDSRIEGRNGGTVGKRTLAVPDCTLRCSKQIRSGEFTMNGAQACVYQKENKSVD